MDDASATRTTTCSAPSMIYVIIISLYPNNLYIYSYLTYICKHDLGREHSSHDLFPTVFSRSFFFAYYFVLVVSRRFKLIQIVRTCLKQMPLWGAFSRIRRNSIGRMELHALACVCQLSAPPLASAEFDNHLSHPPNSITTNRIRQIQRYPRFLIAEIIVLFV
jgi:hypothetical protein